MRARAHTQVSRLLAWTEQQCALFRQSFVEYSYLWTADMQRQFDELIESETDRESGSTCPPLASFDQHIMRYKQLQQEVQDLPSSKTIGFLKIDAKPVKHALASVLARWVNLFQDFLLRKVTNDVTELSHFISLTEKGLEREVNSQDSMLEVMGHLRDVRKRAETTDAMFEPLRHMVSLLAKHGVSTPQEILAGLEQLPISWANVKKKATLTKEKHSKEQTAQAEKLTRQSKDFDFRLDDFVNFFKRNMPTEYSTNLDKAYEMIDKIHHDAAKDEPLPFGNLMELKREAARLNELQELFELYVGPPKPKP